MNNDQISILINQHLYNNVDITVSERVLSGVVSKRRHFGLLPNSAHPEISFKPKIWQVSACKLDHNMALLLD